MKHSISYRHRFRTQISILFCLAELLPLSAQEQKEDKEIRLNMDRKFSRAEGNAQRSAGGKKLDEV